MRAFLKCRYDIEKNGAAATLGVCAGDVRLRATLTDATFSNGPGLNGLNGLALAVEKPGSFIFDYILPNKDYRLEYMSSVKVVDKPLNLTYVHGKCNIGTLVEGTLAFDPSNKVSANYELNSGDCKLKYSYVHQGKTTIEPSYDLLKRSWDFALSRKVYDDDVLKATYQPLAKVLALEWSRDTMCSGCFRISAYLNPEEPKMPKLIVETTWNMDFSSNKLKLKTPENPTTTKDSWSGRGRVQPLLGFAELGKHLASFVGLGPGAWGRSKPCDGGLGRGDSDFAD